MSVETTQLFFYTKIKGVDQMLLSYHTIAQDGQNEIEIKKSRFICSMKRVDTEEEAKAFIQEIKKEHWKANHNCSAFVLGAKQEIQRSSDDGEPSGTAGVPMLEVLKKNELYNVVAVVTRYFGGTKLGAGGLIRAYAHSVSGALKEIGLVEGKLQQEIFVTIQYPQYGKLENFMTAKNYVIKETIYTDTVKVICMIDEEEIESFKKQLIDLFNGQVTFAIGETSYVETLLDSE